MKEFIYFFIALIIHELAHYLAGLCFNNRLSGFNITPYGFTARLKNPYVSFGKKIIISISGPAGNFVFAVLLLCIKLADTYADIYSVHMKLLIKANLVLGIFNLIPAVPLDGGIVLFNILHFKTGLCNAVKVSGAISRVCIYFFIVFGIMQAVITKGNISLLMIGIAFVLMEGSMRYMNTVNIQNLLYREKRIRKKGMYEVRHIVVMEDMSLLEVTKNLDYDRFHIIYVLNNNLNIERTLTEQQLMNALKSCDSSVPIKNIKF